MVSEKYYCPLRDAARQAKKDLSILMHAVRKEDKMKCKKHKKYEAKRKPTGNCEMCHLIWLQSQINRLRSDLDYVISLMEA